MANDEPQIYEAFKSQAGIDWFFDEFMPQSGALNELKGPNGAATSMEIMDFARKAGADVTAITARVYPDLSPDKKLAVGRLEVQRKMNSGEVAQIITGQLDDRVSAAAKKQEVLDALEKADRTQPPKKPWWKGW